MLRSQVSIVRSLRRAGGSLLRRLRLLPGGVPDRLGEDEKLSNWCLPGAIVVFFPDTPGALYQLRAWFGPLRELHREQGVTIVCMDSRMARSIRAEIDIPVITLSQESFLDELIERSNVKLFLYVNYNVYNMYALRLRSVVHVSLMHGDSDKGVSISNQAKAFDFSFVAGRAAVDRYKRYTSLFDAETRCVIVGRPALDADPLPKVSDRPVGGLGTVLYAPTWEGGHDTVSYGSVPSHAEAIVRSLIAAGYNVIYRPHPLTGQRLFSHAEADARVRSYLSGRERQRISVGRPLSADFAAADILISDVSSVANDWLATRKPLLITQTSAVAAREAGTRLLEVVPRLSATDAQRASELVKRELDEDPGRHERLELIDYYLGDVTPGASMARFLDACSQLSELRDREWNRIRSNEGPGRS